MKTVLITGANRGIGLEFCQQYLKSGHKVIAASRKVEVPAIQTLKQEYDCQFEVIALDIACSDSRNQLQETLDGRAIDILINNAGYYGKHNQLGQLDDDEWQYGFKVNTIGPIRLVEALLPNLCKGDKPVVAMLSSKMGSIADNGSGGSYLYRASKAALNAAGRSLAMDVKHRGILVALLHPGWVRTDMGGPNGLIDTDTSVKGMMSVIDGMNADKSGHFFAYDGAEIPW